MVVDGDEDQSIPVVELDVEHPLEDSDQDAVEAGAALEMASGNDLFKVKDEYLFTFGGAGSFEVLDVARQIWREFQPSGIQERRLSVTGARAA